MQKLSHVWSLVTHYQRNRLGSVIYLSFHLSTFMLLKLGMYSWPIWGMIPPDNCTWHKLVPCLRIMLYFMSGPAQNNIGGIENIWEVRGSCPRLKHCQHRYYNKASFKQKGELCLLPPLVFAAPVLVLCLRPKGRGVIRGKRGRAIVLSVPGAGGWSEFGSWSRHYDLKEPCA